MPFQPKGGFKISTSSSKRGPIFMHLTLKGLLPTPELYHETSQFTDSAVLQTAENNQSGPPEKIHNFFQTTKNGVILRGYCRAIKDQLFSTFLLPSHNLQSKSSWKIPTLFPWVTMSCN
ncbi:hypothetical protein J6590_049172 [Homalodisca vitripennis]|nr:hypothetical protein J6590_049172 [Homalodisca vitripennis]